MPDMDETRPEGGLGRVEKGFRSLWAWSATMVIRDRNRDIKMEKYHDTQDSRQELGSRGSLCTQLVGQSRRTALQALLFKPFFIPRLTELEKI